MIAGDLKPTTSKQWLKLALIPVLALVLVVVVSQQLAPRSAPLDLADAAIEPSAGENTADSQPLSAGAPVRPTKSQWPKARLEELIAFNPFEPQAVQESMDSAEGGASDRASATARGASQRDSRSAPVIKLQAIFLDAQGAAAILDSQVVRVGDTLPSGGRVVEITPEGIKLEGL